MGMRRPIGELLVEKGLITTEQLAVAVAEQQRTGKLLGVEVVGDQPGIHFFDDAAAREQTAIDRAFPGTTNRIV